MDSTGRTIPEFFQDCSVFITGGSGFIGKTLIEKLLRCCPGIRKIFVLLRSKRGKSPASRLQDLLSVPLFDRLRQEDARAFEKLIVIEGDVEKLGLGISNEDRTTLVQEVSIVFHSAANIKFTNTLKNAVLTNTRGAREVVSLCLEMKQIKAVIHVSTAYCNFHHQIIEEKIYIPDQHYNHVIELAESLEDKTLEALTPSFLKDSKTTYLFSKRLAEHVFYENKGNLPIAIVRPTMVSCTMEEPMPAWIEGLNGPEGLLLGISKGITRFIYSQPNRIGDYVPADTLINTVIAAAWYTGVAKPNDIMVYNCNSKSKTATELLATCNQISQELPLGDVFWYPDAFMVSNQFLRLFYSTLFHFIPALFIDSFLLLKGKRARLLDIQMTIFKYESIIDQVMQKNLTFKQDHYKKLRAQLLPEDIPTFDTQMKNRKFIDILRVVQTGIRSNILKQPNSSLPQARRQLQRLLWVHTLAKILGYGVVGWFLWYLSSFALNTGFMKERIRVAGLLKKSAITS